MTVNHHPSTSKTPNKTYIIKYRLFEARYSCYRI